VRDADHVALFGVAVAHERERRGQHADRAAGHGDALGLGLAADVHHVGVACGVEMREFGHGGLLAA
jgi:hypothetical protein